MVETRWTSPREDQSLPTIDADGLSDLPDDVLHKVLSYLPMDQVARISVLSKRWDALWLSCPELDFMSMGTLQIGVRWGCDSGRTECLHHEFCHYSTKQADSIPSMVCSRAHLMSSIHGYEAAQLGRLRLKALISPNSLNRLLGSAVRLKIQVLDLNVAMLENFHFLTCLANCESLRVLNINVRLNLVSIPHGPDSTLVLSQRFLSLEVLQISGFTLTSLVLLDTATEKAFPLLRKLHLSWCGYLDRIHIRCLNLREFNLEECPRLVGLEVDCQKLEKLTVLGCLKRFNKCRPHDSLVKLRTPKLRKLYWSRNGFTRHYHLENMEYLMDACVASSETHYEIVEDVNNIAELVHRLSHARSMYLGKYDVQALASLPGSTGSILQPFINLRKLELQSTGFIAAIPIILKSTPLVEDLTLMHKSKADEQIHSPEPSIWLDEEREWKVHCLSHESFLRHLKKVSLVGLSRGNLVGTAKFLLKHVVSLRHMDFSLKRAGLEGGVELEKMKSEILELASTSGTNIHFPEINFRDPTLLF